MIHIGIDFSINSPGCCILDDNGYHFISFFNYGGRDLDKKVLKAFELHFSLKEDKTLDSVIYDRGPRSKEFIIREREKMIDGTNISNLIIKYFQENFDSDEYQVSLEGFSYGSKGNSFIDLIQYNSFLRKGLVNWCGHNNISVYQPSAVKKTAGKGNANKHYMVKAFQDNVLNDDVLVNTKLWKWIKDKDYSEKIPKPIDDLVDAYFILQTGIKNAACIQT